MRRREVLLCAALCASLLFLTFVAETKRPPFWSRVATGDLDQARRAAEEQRDEAARTAQAALQQVAALAASRADHAAQENALRDQIRRLAISEEDWRRRALRPAAPPPVHEPVAPKPVVAAIIRQPAAEREKPVVIPPTKIPPKDTRTSVEKLLNGDLSLDDIDEIAKQDQAKANKLLQMYWEIESIRPPSQRKNWRPSPPVWRTRFIRYRDPAADNLPPPSPAQQSTFIRYRAVE